MEQDPDANSNQTKTLNDNTAEIIKENAPVVDPDDRPIGGGNKVTNSIDELPIGGSKFNFSEFPDENAPVVPKKPVVKKAPLKSKKEEARASVKEEVGLKTSNNQLPTSNLASSMEDRPIGGGMNSQFDQKPIGKSNFTISEFPEDGPPPSESAPVSLPLEQRIKSKAIKTKMTAFQQLTGLVQSGDLQAAQSVQWPVALKQSNPGCLEKILVCFQKYVQKDGRWGDEEIKMLVDSGYINGKGTSKKIAWQIIDTLYAKKPQTIEAAILGGLKGKTMKTVAGFITLINELLSVYGIKKMNYLKSYYPDVIKLISNQKLPLLKTQGTTMLKQACKWLTRDFLQQYFKQHSLKDTIKKQIDQFWDQYDKTAVMSAPKADVQAPAKNGGGKAGGKVDVYNLSEAVDVFKKYNERWVSDVLKTEKWNEKTKMMNDFVIAASVPKIANTDFRHIIDLIKRLISDANMNVVLTTLKIASVMAQGLRKHFSPYAKMFFGNIIQKFKDKKTQMIDETNKCLNDFSYCLSLEDVLQDVKEGLNDKNPNMKVNIMIWIERVLDRKAADNAGQIPIKLKQAIKGLFSIFQKLCNDGAANVREITVRIIAKARALIGQDFFAALENKLGKAIVSKIDAVIVDVPERPSTTYQKESKEPSLNATQIIRPQTSGNPNPLSKTMNLQANEKSAQKVVQQIIEEKPVVRMQKRQKPIEKSPMRVNDRSIHKVQPQPVQRVGLYNGQTIMPEFKYLAGYRMARQGAEQSSPWNYDVIHPAKQEQLLIQISRSFRRDLSARMLAINYKKVQEGATELLKLCKDSNHLSNLRQVYDVILKWVFYRLYGGNLALAPSLIELVPQLLSILQKRNITVSINTVIMVISILRQYFISGVDLNSKLSESVSSTIKLLTKLHSTDRVLQIILKQYQVDLTNIHKHLRKEYTLIYRECLNRIIKTNLIDSVGTPEISKAISQIKELAKDPQFIQLIYSRYNETKLNHYGFNREMAMRTPHRQAQHSPNTSALHNPQHYSTSQTKNSSGLLQPPPLHPNQQQLNKSGNIKPANNVNPSVHLTPNHNSLQAVNSSSNLYNSRGGSQSNLAPQVHQRAMTPPIHQQQQHPQHQPHQTHSQQHSQQLHQYQQQQPQQYAPQQASILSRIHLGSYPCPQLSNPLNEHLSKLNPPNDTTLQFFQALFLQNSQRITAELQEYAKIILGAILKSSIEMIDRRNDIAPQKLSSQLNLLQQALKNKCITRNAGQVLSLCTQFVLKQLVHEDENKQAIAEVLKQRGYDYKVENFIKIINGVMLRILQNGHPHQVIINLIDFLITCMKNRFTSQKTFSLVLKCMGRVVNSYGSELEESNLKELFLKIHQYCTEFDGRLKPDDQGLETMRKLLTEVAKKSQENIWISYEKAMAETNTTDEFISGHFNGLRIPYPQKSPYSEQEQELKKISQMLSKIRTYESGIRLLNNFLEQYENFPIAKYFADLNYEPRFIQKVMTALQTNYNRSMQPQVVQNRKSQQRRQRSVQRSSEDINLEHKIRNLRQRFDEVQVSRQQQQPVQREEDADPDRTHEIRRRITEMKAKLHNVMK